MLKTNLIQLSPVEEHHLKSLLSLQWDDKVMDLMFFKPLTMYDQIKWLKSIQDDKTKAYFAITERQYGQIIGLASLNNIDHLHQRASWGLKLCTETQGMGYGFQAALLLLDYGFRFLNLRKIYGDRIKGNQGSIKLCNALGIYEEGTLKEHCFHKGEFKDITLVGILKDEFYKHNQQTLQSFNICK